MASKNRLEGVFLTTNTFQMASNFDFAGKWY